MNTMTVKDSKFASYGELKEEVGINSIVLAATDEALVKEAKAGDHAAFAELWERHSKKAFNTAYRIGMPGFLCTSFSERNWSKRSWKWHEERSIPLSRL
jgi:hypothetical protein